MPIPSPSLKKIKIKTHQKCISYRSEWEKKTFLKRGTRDRQEFEVDWRSADDVQLPGFPKLLELAGPVLVPPPAEPALDLSH